jgi:hypothetical protein
MGDARHFLRILPAFDVSASVTRCGLAPLAAQNVINAMLAQLRDAALPAATFCSSRLG